MIRLHIRGFDEHNTFCLLSNLSNDLAKILPIDPPDALGLIDFIQDCNFICRFLKFSSFL